MLAFGDRDRMERRKLAALVRQLHAAGHMPATSGNCAMRLACADDYCLVSASGVDKAELGEDDFVVVHVATGAVEAGARTPSAETPIHLQILRKLGARCVVHSHLVEALWFADLHPGQRTIVVDGLELLKGLAGITSHEARVEIRCFDNTQDMGALARELDDALSPEVRAIVLRGHGLYVWGASVDEAKRHLEVFEYVFRYTLHAKRAMP